MLHWPKINLILGKIILMSLQDKVNSSIKDAMLSKDQVKLRGLRAIKSAIMIALTEKGSDGTMNEDQEIKLLQKMAKQRKDSIEIFEEQGRDDLATKEKEELETIEEFLPAQLSEAEIEAVVKEIIEQTGASSMQDMGKVMGASNQKMAGKADGKTISGIVKRLLS